MSQVEINIWNTIQSGFTAIAISLYPFIVCLLYQIRHEMASNPKQFTLRKISLITCLVSQIVIFTFLRDQYVWNEQINEQDELPNALLCGLSRFLYYGIIEIFTYFLIIMIIWDETESQSISKHQLNQKIVQTVKSKYEDRRFHVSTIFKIYTFCVSLVTLLPSSMMPTVISNQFLDGIDKYRCEMSNVSLIIGAINKVILLIFAIYSSIQLRQIETRHFISNTITLFMVIPICILLRLFVLCNENWLTILSLDNSRKISFICSYIMAIFILCTHIMMQAQAKQQIVSGVRRVSTILVQAAETARKSIRRSSLLKSFNRANKIEVEGIAEVSCESSTASAIQRDQKFSVVEITEDEYDAIMIKQEDYDKPKENHVEDVENEEEKQEENTALIDSENIQKEDGANVPVRDD